MIGTEGEGDHSQVLRFDDRVAVITGGGRGLGRCYCEFLAARGARVVVADFGVEVGGESPDSDPARDVVAAISDAGGEAIPSIQDVSTEAGAGAIVADTIEAFGSIDIVINNAGIYQTHPFPYHPLEILQRHLAVHVVGSFNVTRAAWPHLSSTGSGRVLMITSGALYGLPEHVAYSTSKAAVVGLTRSLAIDGVESGVAVNALAPFATTRMSNVGESGTAPQDRPAPALVGPPDFPANLAAYLVHESCQVTGETYFAGSSRIARMFLSETRGLVDSAVTPESVAGAWELINSTGDAHDVGDVVDWRGFHESVVNSI